MSLGLSRCVPSVPGPTLENPKRSLLLGGYCCIGLARLQCEKKRKDRPPPIFGKGGRGPIFVGGKLLGCRQATALRSRKYPRARFHRSGLSSWLAAAHSACASPSTRLGSRSGGPGPAPPS